MKEEDQQFLRSMIEREKERQLQHLETERKYDPVKRKEYYERTKKLKGRKKGKKSDWTKGLQKSAKEATGKDARLKQLKGFSKAKLEATVNDIAKQRKALREKGQEDSPRDKVLKKLQETFMAQYFEVEELADGWSGITVKDSYGNWVEVPWEIEKGVKELTKTSKNDALPELPWGKKDEDPTKGSILKNPTKTTTGNPGAPTPRKEGKGSKEIIDLRGAQNVKKKHWWQ